MNAERGLPAEMCEQADCAPRGRVCNRAGCGRLLADAGGNPVFNRHFCDDDCKRVDVGSANGSAAEGLPDKNAPIAGASLLETRDSNGVFRVTAHLGAFVPSKMECKTKEARSPVRHGLCGKSSRAKSSTSRL